MKTICMEGQNKFNEVDYTITCKFGLSHCIYDKAYMQATYPETYSSISGEYCIFCINANRYDDEDK